VSQWVTVARVGELPEGEMIGATVDGVEVLVANVRGEYKSIGAECTHEGCDLNEGELDVEEGLVTCACHGSIYDLDSGVAVAPPAEEQEPVYRVRIEGDDIQLAKPA
jgi:3-phenylpropionate/trans-cinnamate dioxygenase ferredoxin component